MKVVRSSKLDEDVEPAALADLLDAASEVFVDVGTGDGRFAHQLARSNPGAVVVGVDPSRAALAATAAKAARKPSRGGAPNLLLVVASVEHAPAELLGRATALTVNLPWGRLLHGTVRPEADVLRGLASLAAEGATLTIVLNAGVWDSSTPLDLVDLPAVTPEYFGEPSPAAAEYRRHGFRITSSAWMPPERAAALATTWGRRLALGSGRRFLEVTACYAGGSPGGGDTASR